MEKDLSVVLTINYTREDLTKLIVEISTLLSATEAGKSYKMVERQRELFMETLNAKDSLHS